VSTAARAHQEMLRMKC